MDPDETAQLQREMDFLEKRRPAIQRETRLAGRRVALVAATTLLIALALWWISR